MLGGSTDVRLRHDVVTLNLALLMAFFWVRTAYIPQILPQSLHVASKAFPVHILAFAMPVSSVFAG